MDEIREVWGTITSQTWSKKEKTRNFGDQKEESETKT